MSTTLSPSSVAHPARSVGTVDTIVRRAAARTRMAVETARELARDLSEQLLQPRRIILKHRAPASRYVHQLRRDIAAGKARPFDMVLAVSLSDLDDGAPVASVVAPYLAAASVLQEIGEQLAARAPAADSDGPALLGAIRRENRIQATCDQDEREIIAHPTSREVLDQALSARALYDAASDRLVAILRRRRARLAAEGSR
jgi:hypothetical protein